MSVRANADWIYRVTAGVALVVMAASAHAGWQPPEGVDLTRPRLLLGREEIPRVQARLEREPYRSLLAAVVARAAEADDVALDDDGISAHRKKSRAAKNLAFLYLIDRTLADGEIVVLSETDERRIIGARVHELLLNLYPRSRLAVEPPIGGWDRDISSSEELMQYAVAYDAMLGAGYDFGADETEIVERLVSFTAEFYENYVRPATASTWANLHQNNHRSKTGAAFVTAALALAEYTPEPGSDPRTIRDPQQWLDYGLDLVDLITRWVLVTGDGAYGEGPFYWRFNSQNLLPFARAWNRLLGGRTYVTADGLHIRDFWTHPLFERTSRWMLDMTLPDGSLAPFDDGNPGRSYYFGMLPPIESLRSAFAWRWHNAPRPYESEGNVDLAADAIITYDDEVQPAPPPGSPTAFYIEGGNAVLRSDWSADAVLAMIQGEHDTASEFGRDRDGRGVGPQSHEHAEPGSFLLHAYGERLMLDPGYLDFGSRTAVNQPQHHNLILVDGQGPVDYLDPTFRWIRRTGRPPIDGNAVLSATADTEIADAVTVTTRYGLPAERAARIDRRFVLFDDRVLVIADDVVGPGSPARSYTWLLHGNGGAESGGSFVRTDHGATWTRDRARVTSAAAFDVSDPQFAVETAVHENPGGVESSHRVLRATVVGERVRALHVLVPSRTSQAEPTTEILREAGTIGVVVDDDANEQRYVALRRVAGEGALGHAGVSTDGRSLLLGIDGRGAVRTVWAERATYIDIAGTRAVASDGLPDVIAIRLGSDVVDVFAPGALREVVVAGLPFSAAGVDGACAIESNGTGVSVHVTGDQPFRIRSTAGPGRPAAFAGFDRRVAVGTTVVLDGSDSCDPDGDDLRHLWELVSAPAGSAWDLEDPSAPRARLLADRRGPYRVRLAVAEAGAESFGRESEVVIHAGDACGDGVDDDLDGLFDEDDPDCDAGSRCAGDCSGEGEVTVDELVRGVDIALGQRRLSSCREFDVDDNARVTVDEIIAALDAALRGCTVP